MRVRFVILLVGLMILGTAGLALADDLIHLKPDHVTFQKISKPDDFTQPGGNELDVYSDSLQQYTNTPQVSYQNGVTFYAQMHFTAPGNFEIRGISAFILDQNLNSTTTSMYVYEDNNGAPGTLLGSLLNAPTDQIPFGAPWTYMRIEYPDDESGVSVAAGTEFWVVVGPAPAYNFGTGVGWTFVWDDDGNASFTDHRNTTGTPATLGTIITGDWEIDVLGNVEEFSNVRAAGLVNDVHRFHIMPDEPRQLRVVIENVGSVASTAGSAMFTVEDEQGNTVFTETVPVPALQGEDTDSVTTTGTWTPADDQRFIASVALTIPDDGDPSDNSAMLVQDVTQIDDFFTYTDGTHDATINYQADTGPGVLYYPLGYPATIDTIRFYFPAAANDMLFKLFAINNSNQFTELWSITSNVVVGWNEFVMPELFEITEGSFVPTLVSPGNVSIPFDTNAPISAANNWMPMATISWNEATQEMNGSSSGNWMIQASITSTPPQDIDIIFPPLVTNIGETPVGTPLTYYIPFSNEGEDDGHITQIQNTWPDLEIPAAANLPITIPANGDYDLEIIWTPSAEGPTNMGFQITHDDPEDNNPYIIGLTGNALSGVAYSDPTIPNTYFLEQNKPNPFNPETTIRFGLKAPGHAKLTVYNLMGQEVRTLIDQEMTPGSHTVLFNASDLPSGVYFYSLQANDYRSIQKMMLMK